MLRFEAKSANPETLKLGADFDHVNYCWRPYEERPEDHREDYDRLEVDIAANGIKNPLICFRGQVLIGMRRCEIARKYKIPLVPIWAILDDITKDKKPHRVLALKDLYGRADY